jgi:hypothetical protein
VLLFDRSVSIRFPGVLREISGLIAYQRDEGPRIAFAGNRSIQAEPDQMTVRIWNLPKSLTDRLVAEHDMFRSNLRTIQGGTTIFSNREQTVAGTARTPAYKINRPEELRITDQERSKRLRNLLEQHIVEVWAGYGASSQMIFRGDIVALRPRIRDGEDYVCEIDLGDGFVVLQEQWMAQVYGVGETPANLIALHGALVDAQGDDAKIRAAIGIVAPNAITARLASGYVGSGRPIDAIDEVAEFLGLTWWVRDGRLEFIARGSFLPDFAVVLDASTSLMNTSLTDDGRYRGFQCVLTPQVHPGRAIRIVDEQGQIFNGRVLQTKISGDTHGDEWSISGLCDASAWQALPTVEPTLGPRLQITEAQWDRQTNPRTGGNTIPKALRLRPR